MSKGPKDQSAVVTGGARGIGLGIARRMAAEGCRVALWDLGFEGFKPDAAGFKPALLQVVNVADYASVEKAHAATVAALGPIDILVNNAGINGPVVNVWEYPVETWSKLLAVDLNGVFHCTRVVVPAMRERKHGRIVNIASMAGKEGSPGISAYASAKGGVIAFTKSVARELSDCGVMVNAVAPAITETELFAQIRQ